MAPRVLITGAGGFVGRHLADHLDEQGVDIVGLGRTGPPSWWRGGWQDADVVERASVTAAVREAAPDYVFHLAGLIASDDLAELLRVNVIGTENVLEAVHAERPLAPVLVAGSAAEYGSIVDGQTPVREDHPLAPINPYGVSKAAQSLIALQFAMATGQRVVCTRTFNLVGPDVPDSLAPGAFARQLAEAEEGDVPAVIQTRDLGTFRDFLDVRDAVRAYWLLLSNQEADGIFNVCSGRPVRTRELLHQLLALARVAIEIDEKHRNDPRDVPMQFGDCARLRATTTWEASIPLERSLEDLLAYWRSRVGSAQTL